MIPIATFKRFVVSIKEHRQVDDEVYRLAQGFLEPRYLGPHAPEKRFLKYAQKNFFSILFLAIYRSIGIPPERRVFYGTINHCVRGLVTATDNILDNEYKEMIPVRFADRAKHFKSVMHLLLFDRFLNTIVDRAAEAGMVRREDRASLQRAIFQRMVVIGEEEATEEGGVHELFTPERILAEVHRHKGGNLLRLAFVAPSLSETDLAPPVKLAERGVYAIGMALQVIDDLTDFYPDIVDRRHNYFVSWLHHRGAAADAHKLTEVMAAGATVRTPIETLFPTAVHEVAEAAVGEALRGFRLLNDAGFQLPQQDALWLIRSLFQLRGLKTLIPLLPEVPTPRTLGDSALMPG